MLTSQYVRLTPDERSKEGSIWNRVVSVISTWKGWGETKGYYLDVICSLHAFHVGFPEKLFGVLFCFLALFSEGLGASCPF